MRPRWLLPAVPEIKRDCGFHRKRIKVAHPFRDSYPGHIPRKSRINVAVAKHDGAGFQQRHDIPLSAVRKVGGVDQAKTWRESAAFFLAPLSGILHQR